MAAVTSNPSRFELSDDGANEPESDVSCTSLSAAVAAADHLLTRLQQAPVAAANIIINIVKIKHYIKYNKH